MGTQINQSAAKELRIGDDGIGVCCAWFDRGRGWGFIKVDGAERELFVPARNITNADGLRRGDRVRFEVRLGYDGKHMADNVEVDFGVGR